MKLVSVDLFMTVLGPGCCVGLSLAALRGGPSLGSGSSPRGLLCWGRGLWGLWAPHRRGSSAGGAGSGARGLQQLWLLGSRAQAQWLWFTGFTASWHGGPSWPRDQTHSSALAGGLFTTESPGKPRMNYKFRLRKKSSLLPGPIIAHPASVCSCLEPVLGLFGLLFTARSGLKTA